MFTSNLQEISSIISRTQLNVKARRLESALPSGGGHLVDVTLMLLQCVCQVLYSTSVDQWQ